MRDESRPAAGVFGLSRDAHASKPRASLSGGTCRSRSDAVQPVVEGSLMALGVCLRVLGFIEGIL